MPKRIYMAQLKEVVQLLNQQQSCRQISEMTGVSKSTVSNISKRLKESVVITPENLATAKESVLKELLLTSKKSAREPIDFELISSQLKIKHITLRIIYEEKYASGKAKPYSYSHFCSLYREWEKARRQKVSYTNIEHNPGEIMEIDFAGDKFLWTDPKGEVHAVKLFVSTLSYSQMIFAMAFDNEKKQSWLEGINAAYYYFDGVAQNLVCDNARSLVKK